MADWSYHDALRRKQREEAAGQLIGCGCVVIVKLAFFGLIAAVALKYLGVF
jgi:hypothetical protein